MLIDDLLRQLRIAGGDTTAIEVKSAAGGYPESVIPSLSALANTPGGGTLVFGLSEEQGFAPTGVYDPQALKQRLGRDAQDFVPPVILTISDATLDSRPVVIAEVAECDAAFKPCTHRSSGRAWTRSYDGDFQVSELQRQGFIAARTAPHFDTEPVAGASVDDLDPDAVDAWRAVVDAEDSKALGRYEGEQQLRHGGVLRGNEPTLAGLLMLGAYPQEYRPRYVVHVARVEANGTTRNVKSIAGAIPTMLTSTMEWVAANIDYANLTGDDGNMRAVPTFPLAVIRELVGNALIHRDLAPWSEGIAVNLRLSRDRFIISNPGGLYGLTVDRLGHETVSHSRNPRLVGLGLATRTRDGIRVVESLASGLIRVNRELAAHGLPEPHFTDSVIQFTAILRASATSTEPVTQSSPTSPESALKGNQLRVYQQVQAAQPVTLAQVAQSLNMVENSVRRAMTQLRAKGLIELEEGGPGKISRYAIRDSSIQA